MVCLHADFFGVSDGEGCKGFQKKKNVIFFLFSSSPALKSTKGTKEMTRSIFLGVFFFFFVYFNQALR